MVVVSIFGIKKIRRFVVYFTEFCSVLVLLASALIGVSIGFPIGAQFGPALARAARDTSPGSIDFFTVVMGVFGGASGAFVFFAAASIPLGLVFLLSEIAANTRTEVAIAPAPKPLSSIRPYSRTHPLVNYFREVFLLPRKD
jgi:hypothetical protein